MTRTPRTLAAGVAMGAMLALGVSIGAAIAEQPHMERALDALRTARAELIAGAPNKGGHRAEAIRLTDAAIAEVRAGMDYDRTH